MTTIFRATPYVDGNGHYSGRIAFSPDGKNLYYSGGSEMREIVIAENFR